MAEYLFNEPRYNDPEAAREYLESVRWPRGPVCPHCGAVDRISKLQGKAHRPGVYDCGHCRDQFTVTVGTVFERSKISLDKWLLASSLMAASKKGISSKQIERMLGVTYKTAWFMTHRLREAMKDTSINANNLRPFLNGQMDTANTRLMTDGEGQYRLVAQMFASHDVVNHGAGEYVRGDAYTNTVEGYFSILKRGIIGTFHHVSAQHLQRYVTEFDFRYNHRETKVKIDGKWAKAGHSDGERTDALLKGISGKRLTYRRTHQAA